MGAYTITWEPREPILERTRVELLRAEASLERAANRGALRAMAALDRKVTWLRRQIRLLERDLAVPEDEDDAVRLYVFGYLGSMGGASAEDLARVTRADYLEYLDETPVGISESDRARAHVRA